MTHEHMREYVSLEHKIDVHVMSQVEQAQKVTGPSSPMCHTAVGVSAGNVTDRPPTLHQTAITAQGQAHSSCACPPYRAFQIAFWMLARWGRTPAPLVETTQAGCAEHLLAQVCQGRRNFARLDGASPLFPQVNQAGETLAPSTTDLKIT